MEKEALIKRVQLALEEKLNDAKKNVELLQESLSQEGKSTAGDRHETGRAMIQIEMEQAVKLLNENERHLLDFKSTDFSIKSIVSKGSLVQTNHLNFLVGIPLGLMNFDNSAIFCLSDSAPLLLAAKGKKVNENFTFNNKSYHIISIC